MSFKGDKKKKKKGTKKKNRESKHKSRVKDDEKIEASLDDELTEAERRAMKFKEERELQELENAAEKSHRDRVEEFNAKLSELTEHNDIPRVSCGQLLLSCAFCVCSVHFLIAAYFFSALGQCGRKRIGTLPAVGSTTNCSYQFKVDNRICKIRY